MCAILNAPTTAATSVTAPGGGWGLEGQRFPGLGLLPEWLVRMNQLAQGFLSVKMNGIIICHL